MVLHHNNFNLSIYSWKKTSAWQGYALKKTFVLADAIVQIMLHLMLFKINNTKSRRNPKNV